LAWAARPRHRLIQVDGMPAHRGRDRIWGLEDDVNAVIDRAQSK
jgi:hypothetical protein